jgi:hypothetical protein
VKLDVTERVHEAAAEANVVDARFMPPRHARPLRFK